MDPAEYTLPSLLELVTAVGVALLLGAIIGYDRERKDKPAGLRTHALVSVASCIAMMAAAAMAAGEGNDGIRGLGAIMTGIGFLGAGAIMNRGQIVYGLKTGATIWTAGAAGVVVGAEWFAGAVALTVAVVAIVTGLGALEDALSGRRRVTALGVRFRCGEGFPRGIITDLREMGFEILSFSVEEPEQEGSAQARMVIKAPGDLDPRIAESVVLSDEAVDQVSHEAET